MEKKLFRNFLLTLSAGFILAGCTTDTTEAPEDTAPAEEPDVAEVDEAQEQAEDTEVEPAEGEITASFDIVIDGEAVADLSEEVTVPEGTYLLDVMHDTYDVEEADGFISAIEGYEQDADAGRYWLYYINDEMPSVGAAEYELEDGDQIEWRLEDSE